LIEPVKEANKKWHDRQIKLKRSFRIKVILPIVVIAIIGISVFAISQQKQISQHQQQISQQEKLISVQQKQISLLLTVKGIALGSSGNNAGAIKYFDKALAINPKDANALTMKGIALDELGKHIEAIAQPRLYRQTGYRSK
jgi:Flp pilus assembly protein TadD